MPVEQENRVQKFIAEVASNSSEGLAKANRFSISGPTDAIPRDYAHLIKNVEISGKAVGTYIFRTHGTPIKMPYDITYPELILTWRDTENYEVRNFFNNWMRKVYSDNGRELGYGYYEDYVRTFSVQQYSSRVDVPTYQMDFINAYPIAISDIQLSQESTNQLSEFDVTFAYERWIDKSSVIKTTVSPVPSLNLSTEKGVSVQPEKFNSDKSSIIDSITNTPIINTARSFFNFK